MDASKASRIEAAKAKTADSILSEITKEIQDLIKGNKDYNYIALTFSNLGFDLGVVNGVLPSDNDLNLGSETLEATWSNTDNEDVERWLALTSLKQGYSSSIQTPAELAGQKRAPSGGGGRPQTTTGPSDATAVIKDDLWGKTASDRDYKYTISRDGKSFQWSSAAASGVHKQGDKNWSVMVGRINQLTGVDRVTPTAATPAPAVTPAATTATPAAAPAATTATTLDQSLVQKVAAVLQKAEYTPLNMKSGGSEMDKIKSLKNVVGLIRLAAIIVLRVGDSLTTLPAAKSSDIISGTRKDLAVNMGGKFASDVGIILRQVNEITKIRNQSKAEFQKLINSVSITQGTQSPAAPATAAPATTTAPAAQADDGQNKSASLNKKFIKAATLRRLKIRSQMEAAIDSSAQMGRARVS